MSKGIQLFSNRLTPRWFSGCLQTYSMAFFTSLSQVLSFPKHAKSQHCCDLYQMQKKGSHVVPSISPNSLTALFSPKLSHFMLHAPKLKKKSSLVPRLFHVPIKVACSQLVPRQRFASRAPAVSSHAASASARPVSNQCKYF